MNNIQIDTKFKIGDRVKVPRYHGNEEMLITAVKVILMEDETRIFYQVVRSGKPAYMFSKFYLESCLVESK